MRQRRSEELEEEGTEERSCNTTAAVGLPRSRHGANKEGDFCLLLGRAAWGRTARGRAHRT